MSWHRYLIYTLPKFCYVPATKYLRYWKNHLSFDDGKIFDDVA
jgi:hypothetical protein